MNSRAFSLVSLLVFGAAAALSGAAWAAELPSAVSACAPGREARLAKAQRQAPADTPAGIDGVLTVSPGEARCLMNKLGRELTVIAAMDGQRKLPGAVPMPWAASAGPGARARLAEELDKLTQGRRTQALLVYCHHIRCASSQHVAASALQAGYSSVYWLRAGIEGWHQAGYAFEDEREKDPAERYASLLEECAYTYSGENIAAGVASLPSDAVEAGLELSARRTRQARKLCLERIRPEVEEHKGRKADLEQRIAGNDAEVARSLKAAWAEFDANPAKYLRRVVEDAPLADLGAMLERARARTASPANGASQRDAGRFAAYVSRAERTRPYTCSMKRERNCLPDEVWASLGRLANRENLKTIEQAMVIR